MSYYRGDYYRGDGNYYKGDPFLGALAAGAVRKFGGKAARWALRGLRKTGAKTVGGAIARAGGGVLAAGSAVSVGREIVRSRAPGMELEINPESFAPGGEPLFAAVRKKYRRMNPLNPKALKRALRRAEGFEKFAKQTMTALTKPGSARKFKRATRSR